MDVLNAPLQPPLKSRLRNGSDRCECLPMRMLCRFSRYSWTFRCLPFCPKNCGSEPTISHNRKICDTHTHTTASMSGNDPKLMVFIFNMSPASHIPVASNNKSITHLCQGKTGQQIQSSSFAPDGLRFNGLRFHFETDCSAKYVPLQEGLVRLPTVVTLLMCEPVDRL